MELIRLDAGVAQAWHMATMGGQGSTKKFKHAIESVSIPQTCDVIQKSDSSLRYSLNLLYGLTLIYKHKVSSFASSLFLVEAQIDSRLSRVLQQLESRKATAAKKMSAPAFLADDCAFDIEERWAGPSIPSSTSALDRILKIQLQDLELHLSLKKTSQSLAHYADERERLFRDFINRSKVSADGEDDDVIENFVFDLDGNILDGSHTPGRTFVVDFDEDLRAVTTMVDSISRTQNSQDDHFQIIDVGERAESLGNVPRSHLLPKKRKIVFDSDSLQQAEVCSTSPTTSRPRNVVGAGDALLSVVRKQPPYFNWCMSLLLNETAATQIPTALMSGASRSFDLELFDQVYSHIEVESARNTQARNRELSRSGSPFEFALNDQMFFETISGDNDETRNSENTTQSKALFLETFFDFLRKRAIELGSEMRIPLQLPDEAVITFTELAPPLYESAPVSRQTAAGSFESMLHLATRSRIRLVADHSSTTFTDPSRIYMVVPKANTF